MKNNKTPQGMGEELVESSAIVGAVKREAQSSLAVGYFTNEYLFPDLQERSNEFHYTKKEMVVDLIDILKQDFYFNENNSCVDCGSGKNKVWYNNVPCKEKYECEIDDGNDFLKFDKNVDWALGNPPFHIGWEMTEKAMQVANIGVAFLLNNIGMRSNLEPTRMQKTIENNFYLHRQHLVRDKRWFGIYYFAIYLKNKPNTFISYNIKNY
jgi:hypothetical protein